MVDLEALAAKAKWVRQMVLRMAVPYGAGHVSTAFSQTDLLVALYQGGILRVDPANPKWPERDRFILSKGQGGIGFYPVLADMGFFPVRELDNFCGEGSFLGVHSEWHCPGVEVITGSLGHGLGIGVGMALAAKQRGDQHIVVVMLGDGELYEGSNWEVLWTAAHHKLNRLVVIVDHNKMATIGRLTDIRGANDGPHLGDLAQKFDAFGFDTISINGHDFRQIFNVLNSDWLHQPRTHGPQTDSDEDFGKPLCIIANTIKGKGSRIMETQEFFPHHYRCPKGKDLLSVLADLDMDADEFKADLGAESVGY